MSRYGRAAVVGFVAGGVALGLAGCTGSDEDSHEPPQVDSVAQNFPAPPSAQLENDDAKIGDVAVDACDPLDDGGMRARGTVTNGTEDKQTYQVMVYFVSDDDDATVAHNWASTTVTVPAGESVPFVAERAFDSEGATLTCQVQAVN